MPKTSPQTKPQTRNPAATREKILRAAIRLFAQEGYDGVAVDDIVRMAKVNKRMVYHYFESKAGLYAEALSQVFERLTRVEASLLLKENSVADAIEKIIRAYFEFLETNPEFVALLLWENLQGGKHLRFLAKDVTKAPILETLDTLIAQGIRSGELRADTDRRHMLINLIGLCLIYFSNRHTLSRSVGLNLKDPQELARGVEHAIRLAKHGFLKEGQS